MGDCGLCRQFGRAISPCIEPRDLVDTLGVAIAKPGLQDCSCAIAHRAFATGEAMRVAVDCSRLLGKSSTACNRQHPTPLSAITSDDTSTSVECRLPALTNHTKRFEESAWCKPYADVKVGYIAKVSRKCRPLPKTASGRSATRACGHTSAGNARCCTSMQYPPCAARASDRESTPSRSVLR